MIYFTPFVVMLFRPITARACMHCMIVLFVGLIKFSPTGQVGGAGAGIHARRVTASGGSTSHLRRIHMSGCRFMVVPGNLEESPLY